MQFLAANPLFSFHLEVREVEEERRARVTMKPPSAAELATALTDHSTALLKSLRVNSTALAENSTALIKSLRVKVLDSAELVKSLRVKVQDTAALLKSLKKGERLALVAVGSAAAATAVAFLWRRRRLPPPPPPAVALEDIAKYPGRAAVGVIDAPKSLAFAPGDGVTYLASPPGSSQKLYSLDLASGTVSELLADDRTDESTYTAEEKLRRERLRILHSGVTEYSWSTEGGVMLVPQGSRSLVAIRTSLGGAPVALFDADAKGSPLPAGEPCLDARLSKDGAFCGFVCGGEVFVCSTTGTSAPVQVTHGAKAAGVTHGVASFVAQEEMDRMEGWWLSPDASLLAFEEVDERGVPTFTIPHHVADPHASETHRYPFAGADNPRARLGIVKVRGRADQKVIWLKMPEQKHPGYICRVAWRDEKQLFVQTQSRRQDEVRLLAVDAASGRATLLLTERATNYVNLHDCLIPLANGAFVWASEASGYNHLAVHEADGKRRVALTSGAWVVDSTGSQMLDAKSEVLPYGQPRRRDAAAPVPRGPRGRRRRRAAHSGRRHARRDALAQLRALHRPLLGARRAAGDPRLRRQGRLGPPRGLSVGGPGAAAAAAAPRAARAHDDPVGRRRRHAARRAVPPVEGLRRGAVAARGVRHGGAARAAGAQAVDDDGRPPRAAAALAGLPRPQARQPRLGAPRQGVRGGAVPQDGEHRAPRSEGGRRLGGGARPRRPEAGGHRGVVVRRLHVGDGAGQDARHVCGGGGGRAGDELGRVRHALH